MIFILIKPQAATSNSNVECTDVASNNQALTSAFTDCLAIWMKVTTLNISNPYPESNYAIEKKKWGYKKIKFETHLSRKPNSHNTTLRWPKGELQQTTFTASLTLANFNPKTNSIICCTIIRPSNCCCVTYQASTSFDESILEGLVIYAVPVPVELGEVVMLSGSISSDVYK